MILTTTDTIPQPYEVLGLVSMTRSLGRLTLSRNFNRAAETLFADLPKQASGADAIIGIRVASLSPGLTVVTGTAVRFTK